jgi:serine/threonine protein kinase
LAPAIPRVDRLILDPSLVDVSEPLRETPDYVVYGGVHSTSREQIAIFAYRTRLAAANQQLFLRTLQLWYRVQHPAVLPLVGFSFVPKPGSPQAGPVVVTPLVRGATLEDVLKAARQGKPPEFWTAAARAQFAFGIAAAMAAFHEKGIVYRALTPRRVLIGRDGGPLIGFVDVRDELSRSRDTDRVEATSPIIFVAPELLRDSDSEGATDQQSDVYSYGVLLYLMFSPAAELRFSGGDVAGAESDLKSRVVAGERFADLPEIPRAYWNLIERCWGGNAAERPTFRAVLEELRDHERYGGAGTEMDALTQYQDRLIRFESGQ